MALVNGAASACFAKLVPYTASFYGSFVGRVEASSSMRKRRVVRLFKHKVQTGLGIDFAPALGLRARGATRGPLDVLDVRSST